VISWDTRSKEIFGITKDDAPIEVLVECVHPDDRENVSAAIEPRSIPSVEGRLQWYTAS
jgi:PAS fold